MTVSPLCRPVLFKFHDLTDRRKRPRRHAARVQSFKVGDVVKRTDIQRMRTEGQDTEGREQDKNSPFDYFYRSPPSSFPSSPPPLHPFQRSLPAEALHPRRSPTSNRQRDKNVRSAHTPRASTPVTHSRKPISCTKTTVHFSFV